jgi:hypothetical protein
MYKQRVNKWKPRVSGYGAIPIAQLAAGGAVLVGGGHSDVRGQHLECLGRAGSLVAS